MSRGLVHASDGKAAMHTHALYLFGKEATVASSVHHKRSSCKEATSHAPVELRQSQQCAGARLGKRSTGSQADCIKQAGQPTRPQLQFPLHS